MDWLSDNFIANMYGPLFLLFYAFVIFVTLVLCWWNARQSDPTPSLPPLPIPPEPNAYEIAYLRSGSKEVARVVLFNLIQRGYLRINEGPGQGSKKGGWEQQLERAPDHPDPRHLNELERCAFDWASMPHTGREVLESPTLAHQIRNRCGTFIQQLHAEQLLLPREAKKVAIQIAFAGFLIIAGLGGYKLAIALSKGRFNVLFLIVMGALSCVLLFKTCWPRRLSARGRKYLKQLENAFRDLRYSAPALASSAAAPALLLAVSLFGLGTLAGSPYETYQKMLVPPSPAATGGGGCGGGCGSCGGGGCGGGCGGCGG